MSAAKVELGRRLFYDRRLSGDGAFSCASCHRQELAFTDGRPRAVGATGDRGRRGAMSLANVAYNPAFDWADPTTTSLEEQAARPLFNRDPVELGAAGREAEIEARLAADRELVSLFAAAFPEAAEAVTLANAVRAIAAFERTLVSGGSPWDRRVFFDDPSGLPPGAERGAELFFSNRLGCARCHGGFNFSGAAVFAGSPRIAATFHDTGLVAAGGDDPGVFEVSGREEDRGRFRAPTLRNIELTAPYMHDGRFATLDEVIDFYAAGPGADAGLEGFELSAAERADLLAFLASLTDRAFITDPRFGPPAPPGS